MLSMVTFGEKFADWTASNAGAVGNRWWGLFSWLSLAVDVQQLHTQIHTELHGDSMLLLNHSIYRRLVLLLKGSELNA